MRAGTEGLQRQNAVPDACQVVADQAGNREAVAKPDPGYAGRHGGER